MTTLEVRGLTAVAIGELIAAELGGLLAVDGGVTGPNWQVRIVPLPRAAVGRFAVLAHLVEISGADEAAVAGRVRRLMMRGGG